MSENCNKLIYIGGVEHSGSTLLGLLLEQSPGVICVGELSQLPRTAWVGGCPYQCSCGKKIDDCEFWSIVRKKWETKTRYSTTQLANMEKYDRNNRFPVMLFNGLKQTTEYKRYLEFTKTLFDSILETSNRYALVDTSKRVSRALSVSRLEGTDSKVIHLVRDSRAVAYSSDKEKRGIKRDWFKSALRWNSINLAFLVLQKRLGENCLLRVRYEDLINNPLQTLEEISKFTGIDLSRTINIIKNNELLSSYHITIGNGFIRQGKEIRFSPDDKWHKFYPKESQEKMWRMTSVLMKRFDYEQ